MTPLTLDWPAVSPPDTRPALQPGKLARATQPAPGASRLDALLQRMADWAEAQPRHRHLGAWLLAGR